jgi:hypothetical protein
MGFVQRELEKISAALRDPQAADSYDRLYAVQQALSWSLDPTMFKRPYSLIMDIQEDSEGCPSLSNPASS